MATQKKRKTRKKVNFELSDFEFVDLCIFFTIAFYFYLKIYITSRIGLNGASYVFSAFELIILFIVLVPYSLKHIMSRLLKGKLRNGQFKNAKRLLYGAFTIVTFYSVIVSLILIIFSGPICKEFLINSSSKLCLYFLLPTIFFAGTSGVIKGFLQAINASSNILIIEIIEKIAMIFGVIIFCNTFSSYGEKVSYVLMSPEYKFAFGAAGSSLGISIGMFIATVLCLLLYFKYKTILNRNDNNTRIDDIYDILALLRADIFKYVGPFFFIVLFVVIAQTFFFRQMEASSLAGLITYQWGAFSGIFINIILIPSMWIMSRSYLERDSIVIGARNGNFGELKIKISEMFEMLMSYLIPFAIFIFVIADYLIRGFALIESDLSVRILRTGILLVITVPFIISSINILQSLGKPMMVMLNGIIALVLGVTMLVVLIPIIKLNLYGVIISMTISSLVYAFLNLSSIKKVVRLKVRVQNAVIIPLIASVIAGIITFLLGLLFNLFLPATINAVICLVIYYLIIFIAYAKTSVITEYTLSKTFLGNFIYSLGKSLRIL